MTRFLLLVKDILQHSDFIYDSRVIDEKNIKHSLKTCCEDLIKTNVHITELPNNDIIIHDTYAEIVYTTNTVSKGWIYNYNVISKQVAVLVQCVPVLDTQQSSPSVACQTEPLETCTVTLNSECIDDLCNFDSNKIELSYHSFYQSLIPVTSAHTPTYTGYANTLLFPTWRDQFTIELKQKLSQPNLGLRRNN
uniref:Uncharacterized protein n=1 Tax=viral metagenome TaxID=1070528 RepID=A0A6C0H788_9ZZZZ